MRACAFRRRRGRAQNTKNDKTKSAFRKPGHDR
jgi:hypothetical protein